MGSNITGLDQLQKRLKNLERKAGELDGSSVPMTEVITPEFLQGCSRFSSLEEMIDARGFSVESQEDFTAIPDEQWDEFISANTSYDSWRAMLDAAGAEYAKKEFGL